ncbi:hypothetical protein K4E_21840 [Enterococcus thailandicus]|nr:hypothetical protein K4E_21840 [Enterococcus thailandicus]
MQGNLVYFEYLSLQIFYQKRLFRRFFYVILFFLPHFSTIKNNKTTDIVMII